MNFRSPWTRSVTEPMRSCLYALMIKQEEKKLAEDNQAIKAQQQLLQTLCPKQHSSRGSRYQPANKARPKPRPRTHKTPQNVKQTCNFEFASMQAQLSELQKMFCQLSESVNVNKNRVEPYTGVSFSDSKSTHPKRCVPTSHKKRLFRPNSVNKLLTHKTRAQNERYIKNLSNQALLNDEVKLLSRGLKFMPTPSVPSSNKSLLKDFDNFARTLRLKYMFANKRKTSAHPFHVKSPDNLPYKNRLL